MGHPGKWGEGRIAALLMAAFLAGCTEAPSEIPAQPPAPDTTSLDFDPATAGSIQGRVTWEGPLPRVEPFEVAPIVAGIGQIRERTMQPNPNRPLVHAKNQGVGNAVVFLRGIDLSRSRPWGHPPVLIEQKHRQFRIVQGDRPSSFGFIRRGESVEMVSRDPVFHGIRANGAAYFSVMFPDPDRPRRRTLTDRGVVELSSAAGQIWMRAYLFVDDHPYYARTDADGRFRLEGVPPGDYELVAWMPSWHVVSQERDPESCQVVRVTFGPAVEAAQNLSLAPAETIPVEFIFKAEMFDR
jgi:hypothetical protein